MHFIHIRSTHENALPLIVTHRWPGSVIEMLKLRDPLKSDGTRREGSGRFPSDNAVDAWLRVFRPVGHYRMGPRRHRMYMGCALKRLGL